MKILNTSHLTKDMQVNFSRKLFMKSFKKSLIIIELVSALAIVLTLTIYIEKYWIAIVAGVIAIGLPVASILMFNHGIKQMEQSPEEKFEELQVDFEIEETIITAIIKFDGQQNVVSQALNGFDQIYETKDLFVLILNNQQAFFIEKNGFLSITDCEKVSEIFKTLPAYKKF